MHVVDADVDVVVVVVVVEAVITEAGVRGEREENGDDDVVRSWTDIIVDYDRVFDSDRYS
jgi:hypothetical protein